jgi:hypothetical protein
MNEFRTILGKMEVDSNNKKEKGNLVFFFSLISNSVLNYLYIRDCCRRVHLI